MTMDNAIEDAAHITYLEDLLKTKNETIIRLKAHLKKLERIEALYAGQQNIIQNQRKEITRLKRQLRDA